MKIFFCTYHIYSIKPANCWKMLYEKIIRTYEKNMIMFYAYNIFISLMIIRAVGQVHIHISSDRCLNCCFHSFPFFVGKQFPHMYPLIGVYVVNKIICSVQLNAHVANYIATPSTIGHMICTKWRQLKSCAKDCCQKKEM